MMLGTRRSTLAAKLQEMTIVKPSITLIINNACVIVLQIHPDFLWFPAVGLFMEISIVAAHREVLTFHNICA